MADGELEVRVAADDDLEAVLGVATRALGWQGDERDRAFFRWKHEENPFGPSPAWVATLDGQVVGFRTFMRWELARRGEVLRMVRAVDTATDPSAQGRGIFRRLTLHAVDAMATAGDDAVFNTPNDQSRPGYLKMGWSQLGRPSAMVVPRSPAAVVRMARSRVPAALWSEPTEVGQPAVEVIRDLTSTTTGTAATGHDEVASWRPDPRRWATPRTGDYLRWRYSFEPLRYRAVEVRGGACVFRVRQRGPSREVAITEWLSDQPDPRAVHRLVRAAGDYAIGVGLTPRGHAALPMPRLGPIVTWRPLARPDVPELSDLALGLGDLELF